MKKSIKGALLTTRPCFSARIFFLVSSFFTLGPDCITYVSMWLIPTRACLTIFRIREKYTDTSVQQN